jgi:hypothetical protein
MSKRTIYVAGGSDERRACQDAINVLKAADYHVTHEWPKDSGYPENGNKPRGVLSAIDDLKGVEDAQYFWLRIPEKKTEGGFAELGAAIIMAKHQPIMQRSVRKHNDTRCVIVSGDWARSIFAELADMKFSTHDMALMWLLGVAP